MSRGPGDLQRKILHELSQEPGGRLPWRWLRQRYPHEVRQKSFFRAIRSLRRMGRILDYTSDYGPGRGGRCRYIGLAHYYAYNPACEVDRQLAALAYEAQRQLSTVAAARGVRLEPSRISPSEGISVDTYQRGSVLSD